MMDYFFGKKLVVTGGSEGIGKATAILLANRGASVLITGTNEEKLSTVAGYHDKIHMLVNDARSPVVGDHLRNAVDETFGKIDGLFLNAGFGVFGPHSEVTAEKFDQQYHVNVRAPLLETAALSDGINDGGSILINTSIAQHIGMDGGILYNSTKAAMRTVTRVLARELAPRKIRVNAVSPGPIGTSFFDRMGVSKEQETQMKAAIGSQVPLGRFGEPEEVATVACFLLSSEASYVTGAELAVDGGMKQV